MSKQEISEDAKSLPERAHTQGRTVEKVVKVFRIEGEINRPDFQTSFKKEVRALKPEDAVERVYSEIGSQHRAKRIHIKILSIREIVPEEAESTIIRRLSGLGDKYV